MKSNIKNLIGNQNLSSGEKSFGGYFNVKKYNGIVLFVQ